MRTTLLPDDILFLKGDGAYVEIHTYEGMILQRKLLKDIEDELPDFFIRSHRSYLVNKNKIEQMTAGSLFINSLEIPISRTHRDSFK